MSDKLLINSNFKKLENNEDKILLQNHITGALVAMSELEYKLILDYSKYRDYDLVKSKNINVQIEINTLKALINKALNLNILVDEFHVDIDRKERALLGSRLSFILTKFIFFLNRIFKINLIPEFSGNLRFYKLFSITLDDTLVNRFISSQKFSKILIFTFIIAFVVNVSYYFINSNPLIFAGFAYTKISFYPLFILIIFLVFFCLFIHEMGHYIIYKFFNGSSSKIGVGLMYVVFPNMYTNVTNVHFWKSKRKKLILSLAGIFVDLFMFFLIGNFLKEYHESNFFSLIIACLYFYYVVQLISNLNFFLPGTDGYYFFVDLVNINRLFGTAYSTTKDSWKKITSLKFPLLSIKEYLLIVYFLFACLFITIYWLSLLLILSFPLWSKYLR